MHMFTHFFYKEKLWAYDVDNNRILRKSVEIKVSSKMAGYKMNVHFNAVFYSIKLNCTYKNGKIIL